MLIVLYLLQTPTPVCISFHCWIIAPPKLLYSTHHCISSSYYIYSQYVFLNFNGRKSHASWLKNRPKQSFTYLGNLGCKSVLGTWKNWQTKVISVCMRHFFVLARILIANIQRPLNILTLCRKTGPCPRIHINDNTEQRSYNIPILGIPLYVNWH